MKNLYKNILPVFFAGASISLSAQSTTFNYTGAVQTYVVPPCVTSITFDVYGAQGGGPNGGLGGRADATIPVTPGATLYIYVGGQPNTRPGIGSGGYNGGGAVNALPCGGGTNDGWGGGGASDVRISTLVTDRIIVGGGGGGSGWTNGLGGAGGGNTGGDGAASWIAGTQGFGATQSAGGAGGLYTGNMQSAGAGSLGQGGDAGPVNTYCIGGGGGGGYYGGGGGYVSAGAGGSSYISYPGSSAQFTAAGFQTGNGQVIITPVNGVPTPGPITGSTSICQNAAGNYSIPSIVGATSYTWTVPGGSTINSGQGTTSINMTAGSTSGNISVTATFPCGTSAPASLSLTINLAPTVGATVSPAATVCIGSSVTLSGTGATSYVWSGGVTNAVAFVPASTTTYTVTGTTAGCSGTATQIVTVNPLPTVTANSTSTAVCVGSNITLTGGGATTYSWSGGVTNAIAFSPVSTNTYTVTGTDANGCVNTAATTVTVNPLPIVTANSSLAAVCNGGGVILSGGGASTYAWSGGVTDAVVFIPTSTNTYTVTGTDGNGCVNTASTTVTVNPIPVVALGPDITQCGGMAMLDASNAGSSYQWSDASTNQTLAVSTSGSYSVVVTDVNGCIGSDAILVTINALPTVTANSTSAAVCAGNSVTLTGGGATTYSWTGGVTNAVAFTPVSTNTYTVTGTDANGCANTATTTVTVNALPTVTGSATTTTACLSDAAIVLTGSPVGGTWSGPGVTASSFSPSSAGLGTQTVTYNFTDVNGCSGNAAVTITVNSCTGIAQQDVVNGINIFPNPSNGVFTISANANVGDLLIVITDMQGRVVYSSTEINVQAGFAKQINLEKEASGLYLMQISVNGKQMTEKISIQK